MRDWVIIFIIAAGCIMALRRPFIGILLWTWLSIMNPHQYTWAAATMPLAMIVAITTLIGVLTTKEKLSPFQNKAPVLLLIFMIWMCITFPFSYDVDGSYWMLNKVMKINLMILVAAMVVINRDQIKLFTWLVVFSIAFYGIKGGIFTLTTGGAHKVWGPPTTYIEGNNELALAVIVIIPMLNFLRTLLTKSWQKNAMLAAMILCAASSLGSHSRGALLALVAMAFVLWWRSPGKLLNGIAIASCGVLLVLFMPAEWTERMNTIENYQEDSSAMGRINAWWMAWNLAINRFPIGGGFEVYNPFTFGQFAPDPRDIHAAHSIYFQILGEHGFVGLLLYLMIWFTCWRTAQWLRTNGKLHSESQWVVALGSMAQVSMMGFFVGGAFLSLAYYDLPFNLMVILVVTQRWVKERMWEKETALDASLPPIRGALALIFGRR